MREVQEPIWQCKSCLGELRKNIYLSLLHQLRDKKGGPFKRLSAFGMKCDLTILLNFINLLRKDFQYFGFSSLRDSCAARL